MFTWAILFLLVALIAAIFGFGGVAALSAAGTAKIIFLVAIGLAIVSFVVDWRREAQAR